MSAHPAVSEPLEPAHRFAIALIREATARWRVLVEAWPETAGGYRGRLVFEPEGEPHPDPVREGPALLRGRSPEEVARAAYDFPEARLRTLLRSLG